MQAICFAMEATIQCNNSTVIFSDSQAVIKKLLTPGAAKSPTKEKFRNMAAIMKKRGRAIALQWISGHAGRDGNEQADKVANLGSAEIQPVLPLSYRTVKSLLSSY
ncbi:ribonuclease H-like [Halyomorpha halys]|uniref:ribonuclease H-like n=1 Tax=Halyomorpha halys TaxID=286706 RepID=UPI0034D1DABD